MNPVSCFGDLTTDLRRYHDLALADSTRATYQSSFNSYVIFCTQINTQPFPVQQPYLQYFVTALARRLSYRTIKVYLSGIQYHSVRHGYQSNIAAMDQLYYLLRGIRRSQGNSHMRPRRAPITISNMYSLLNFIRASQYHPTDQLMLRSAVTLAFFGLLRSAEYTSPSPSTFDLTVTLLPSDVSILPDMSMLYVHIKASKTDPFKSGCTIRIATTNNVLCPVQAFHDFITVHPGPHRPLFIFNNGSFLTRLDITNLLLAALPSNTNLNTHSFRIGGASAAASAGVPDSTIQVLGRWSSNAFRRYLHLSDNLIQDTMWRIARSNVVNRIWDTGSSSSM